MNQGSVLTSLRGHLAYLTFSHPAGNSLPSNLLNRLVENINRLSQNTETRVIILQSEGKGAFCGGASFNELTAIENFEQGKAFFSGFARVINAMRKCKKPILGRVQGKAVGGGVGLIAATDYCFATEKASIKLSELSIGIGPFVIEPAVSRKTGVAAMNKLTYDATEWHTAYWAQNHGLYARVFDKISEMDDYVTDLAEKLAGYNPEALYKIKAISWKNTEHWDKLLEERAKISGKLVLSDFTKTALQKFRR
ncbi:MAG: enoyl-CoA hydratase [Flavobacteriales bacterium]|nr:MAG: enoyl-CoA hydratase [Flavobacteriales bacterium]